jgi:hypothetical protein
MNSQPVTEWYEIIKNPWAKRESILVEAPVS